jgi:hypothetical protein
MYNPRDLSHRGPRRFASLRVGVTAVTVRLMAVHCRNGRGNVLRGSVSKPREPDGTMGQSPSTSSSPPFPWSCSSGWRPAFVAAEASCFATRTLITLQCRVFGCDKGHGPSSVGRPEYRSTPERLSSLDGSNNHRYLLLLAATEEYHCTTKPTRAALPMGALQAEQNLNAIHRLRVMRLERVQGAGVHADCIMIPLTMNRAALRLGG